MARPHWAQAPHVTMNRGAQSRRRQACTRLQVGANLIRPRFLTSLSAIGDDIHDERISAEFEVGTNANLTEFRIAVVSGGATFGTATVEDRRPVAVVLVERNPPARCIEFRRASETGVEAKEQKSSSRLSSEEGYGQLPLFPRNRVTPLTSAEAVTEMPRIVTCLPGVLK